MKNSKLTRTWVIGLATLMLSLWLPAGLRAATLTWDGGYTGAYGATWNNGANWGRRNYVDNSDLVFAGGKLPSTYLSADRSVSSITFSNTAGLFKISLFTKESPPGDAADLTFNSTNTGIVIQPKNMNAQIVGKATDTGVVILKTNLAVALNSSAPLYFLRPVTGPFGIIKNGPGSLYLLSSNTYSGPTTVNMGKVVVSSQSTGGGAFTFSDGTTFGVDRDTPFLNHTNVKPTLALSSLTLGTTKGATLNFILRNGNTPNASLMVAHLTLKGTNAISIEGSKFSIGQFPLLKYTAKSGSGIIATPVSLPSGVAGVISNNAANGSFDLVITAIPPNHSAARTAVRIDEATPYQNSPDTFPVNKADLDMVMLNVPVAQHLFNTSEALVDAPYNKTNAYPPSHFIKAIKKYEADFWHVPAAWIYREDQKHVKGGGYFDEDLRVLSAEELANIRTAISNSTIQSKDVKLIQLLVAAPSFSKFSPELMNQLLRFDGVGAEAHVGDSDHSNQNNAAARLAVLQQMAAIAKWATDNGKIGFTFMGGSAGSYSDLSTAQHTFASLWREMLRLGVDYRAANLIYIRQGAHHEDGTLAGVHLPESDPDTLAYQQKWVIQALKDTSLFITGSGNVSMNAGITARIRVTAGKAERQALTYSAASSNPTLISNANLTLSGRNDGLDHILSMTPNPGQTGVATITLSVSDGVDTRTDAFSLTVKPFVAVPAVANGWINHSKTWARGLPVRGDAQTWQTGTRTINMSGRPADTFNGGTLEVQSGGMFAPQVTGAKLTLNNLTLSGGTIATDNKIGLVMDLKGHQFTLNSGTLRSGATRTMNVTFENALLTGTGTIHITGSAEKGAEVEFDRVNTMGFTGIFSVHDYGRLNLPLIIPDKASFGLNISGTGKYANDADVTLTSLVLGTNTIPPGTYGYTNFTGYERGFLLNQRGIITVIGSLNH